MDIYDVIGVFGAIIMLLSYFLLQVGYLNNNGYLFSTLELLGAVLVLISLFAHWNLASVIVETVWAIISIVGLLRNYFQHRSLISTKSSVLLAFMPKK